MPGVFEHYIRSLVELRGSTVPETSYYALLEGLLDEAGADLRPKIDAVTHPRDTGAGIPDLGLFDTEQPRDQKPARGVVEVKPVSANLMSIAHGEQVARYVAHYGQVVVTNYYQFVLVTRGTDGRPVIEEDYRLADDEAAFWEAAAHPRTLASAHEIPLREYLLRVMRRNAPLATPQDVAWMLASYARASKAHMEAEHVDLEALSRVRQQLESALGIRFEDEEAQEFFRSTLVQTLFYGVFSAWVLWHEKQPARGEKFDLWRDTREMSVPVVNEIFEEITKASHLRPLGLERILEWTADALNRVDTATFFERFERGDAVQYFYEPFLEAFDPDLRRQLGVWYTPREIVRYMVARVDAALRDELGIADGLADPNVIVLDPCCGTGAYLLEVLNSIYTTMERREGAALAAQTVQRAIRERVFGFELLPAPFVVSHLQIGILLNNLNAPLKPAQRAGVYLTNSLTGWQEEQQPPLDFPELRKEREAAESVKRQRPILVILGNPPYSGYAGIAIGEESDLVNAYRQTKRAPAPQGQGLNDLYVRFFRMAERKITEQTGQGIVCFISNYSWLDGLSHSGMRERFLESFDSIRIDCLNGDKYRTGKTTPDGKPDPSIFSTDFNREGIQVGTAIATLVRQPVHEDRNRDATVRFRNLWGVSKRTQLSDEAKSLPDENSYESIAPIIELGLPLMPRLISASYFEWPKLPELFPTSFPGVKTSRDDVLVDIDRERLEARMKQYFDPAVSHAALRQSAPGFMSDGPQYDAEKTRDILRKRGFLPENIVRYAYRPFDVRWLYWEPETKLLDRNRPEYFPHVQSGNIWIEARQRQPMEKFDRGLFTTRLGDNLGNGLSSYFPLYLYNNPTSPTLFDMFAEIGRRPNLTDRAQTYLAQSSADPEGLFYHTLAVLHAPAYRTENAGALRSDWPRVPLPKDRDALLNSAALGRQVAALLDVETPVPGVTQGDPRPELAQIATVTVAGGGAPNFEITAGWGHFGSGSAVMPGRGRVVERDDGGLDIYLNDTTYWANVPQEVWAYTLGGYQVLKKWLSYREKSVLDRALKAEEAREFMHIVRRIAALLALNESLDAQYRLSASG